MDLVNKLIDDVLNMGPASMECHAAPENNYKNQVDELFSKVEKNESTLWRLKFFVKDVLKDESNNSSDKDGKNNIVSNRKREICNALAKTAKRQKKKAAS